MPRARLATSPVTIYTPHSLLLGVTATRPMIGPWRHFQDYRNASTEPLCGLAAKGDWGRGRVGIGSSRTLVACCGEAEEPWTNEHPQESWLWCSLARWPRARWYPLWSSVSPYVKQERQVSPCRTVSSSAGDRPSTPPVSNDRHDHHLMSAHRCWIMSMHYSS